MEDILLKRISSGVLCAVSLFLVVFISSRFPYTLNLVVSLLSCLSSCELLKIRKEFKFSFFSICSIIFSSLRALVGPGTKWHAFLYVYMLICFIISMKRFIKNRKCPPSEFKSVWNICFVFFLNVVVSMCLGMIVEIRNVGKQMGLFLSTLTLIIAWMCDVGSYFFGKKFGKHKLCQYVSPKKTVEGAIGGVSTSVFSAILFSLICEYFFGVKNLNYMFIFFVSLLGAPISILGDLCFSLIKRLLIVKDFGDIIPGHGGILDRFDSVIFLAPFVFISIRILNASWVSL